MAEGGNLDFQMFDPEEEIIGEVVKRSPNKEKKERKYPIQAVTFFSELFSFIACTMVNCFEHGHRRYGIVADENLPVEFCSHLKGEVVYYQPIKERPTAPFRTPQDNDVLMNGIRWHTLNPHGSTAGVKNSCMIDSFLTDLKMRALDVDFCFSCLFFHRNGSGLLLERTLETLREHLVMYAKPKKEGLYQVVKNYTAAEDLKIKRIWLDKNGFKLFRYRDTDDLMYLPLMHAGWDTGVRISMDLYILRRLDSICKIITQMSCNCKSHCIDVFRGLISKVYQDERDSSEKDRGLEKEYTEWCLELAYNTNQKGMQEFEDRMWDWEMLDSGIPPALGDGKETQPLTKKECEKCKSKLELTRVEIPETTWLFIAEFSEELRKTPLSQLAGIEEYIIKGVIFQLMYVAVFKEDLRHHISLHRLNGKWYYYDDLQAGTLKSVDISKVNYKNKSNIRAFYYRRTPTRPHRCLIRMDQEARDRKTESENDQMFTFDK